MTEEEKHELRCKLYRKLAKSKRQKIVFEEYIQKPPDSIDDVRREKTSRIHKNVQHKMAAVMEVRKNVSEIKTNKSKEKKPIKAKFKGLTEVFLYLCLFYKTSIYVMWRLNSKTFFF